MSTRFNLNADMGESYGHYTIGDDQNILKIVRSVNVACGMHGGDPTVMHDVALKARENGVSVGAHPGFNDLWGFGRRQISMKQSDLEYLIAYQIGALQAIAALHGADATVQVPFGRCWPSSHCWVRAIMSGSTVRRRFMSVNSIRP